MIKNKNITNDQLIGSVSLPWGSGKERLRCLFSLQSLKILAEFYDCEVRDFNPSIVFRNGLAVSDLVRIIYSGSKGINQSKLITLEEIEKRVIPNLTNQNYKNLGNAIAEAGQLLVSYQVEIDKTDNLNLN